ncbi:MAG TPA: response regulator transcription factor [Chitinophaga sp.]|uniref:response regulator transcription factor n=1 Tax=Chitinophaga sp. TaxID=1869181 RepID=UPI002C78F666|nr:response regulator transcription factor [Chitinophaga sp.]HVI46202.1 response regulator transcription factor [Chitinophaga sp.]
MNAGINVLYLEDEVRLGKITCDALMKEGFQVTWVKNGADGLTIFKNDQFDICVVDIMLPKFDGYSFVKEVRAFDRKTPVLFLTARILTEDVVKGFEIGGNDYLRKPFSIEELTVRIRELVKRSIEREKSSQKIFQIGRYTFDYGRMELGTGGKSITLTSRENELIMLLIENRESIVPRRNALLTLWGSDDYFNARSMDVFISKIRKYLSADSSIAIVNVRGVGYKLVVS